MNSSSKPIENDCAPTRIRSTPSNSSGRAPQQPELPLQSRTPRHHRRRHPPPRHRPRLRGHPPPTHPPRPHRRPRPRHPARRPRPPLRSQTTRRPHRQDRLTRLLRRARLLRLQQPRDRADVLGGAVFESGVGGQGVCGGSLTANMAPSENIYASIDVSESTE